MTSYLDSQMLLEIDGKHIYIYTRLVRNICTHPFPQTSCEIFTTLQVVQCKLLFTLTLIHGWVTASVRQVILYYTVAGKESERE